MSSLLTSGYRQRYPRDNPAGAWSLPHPHLMPKLRQRNYGYLSFSVSSRNDTLLSTVTNLRLMFIQNFLQIHASIRTHGVIQVQSKIMGCHWDSKYAAWGIQYVIIAMLQRKVKFHAGQQYDWIFQCFIMSITLYTSGAGVPLPGSSLQLTAHIIISIERNSSTVSF
jgi:hypothetical protein